MLIFVLASNVFGASTFGPEDSGDGCVTCNNVNNGGSVGSDQSGCGGFDPVAFTNISSPSGGSGSLEIIWIYKNASTGWNFVNISGATSLTYDPSSVTETTIFRSCARRSGCSDYVGETNDITITITGPCCNASIDALVIYNTDN